MVKLDIYFIKIHLAVLWGMNESGVLGETCDNDNINEGYSSGWQGDDTDLRDAHWGPQMPAWIGSLWTRKQN